MKPILLFATTFLAAFVLTQKKGCDPPPKTPGGDISRDVKFMVFVGDTPVQGAEVYVLKRQGATDETGTARIFVPKNKRGQTTSIQVVSPLHKINKTFEVKITNPTELRIGGSAVEKPKSRNQLESGVDDLNKADALLDEADQIITYLEGELSKLKGENPHTAMDNFSAPLNQRRAEHKDLKDRVADLISRYKEMLENVDEDAIVDLSELDAARMSIKANINAFIAAMNTTHSTFELEKAAQPKGGLSMDIFFEEGAYQLATLTGPQQDALEGAIRDIRQLLDENFSEYSPSQYRFEIRANGYTDGKPVGAALNRKIQSLCPPQYRGADGNNCLSYLRASEILRHIAAQFPEYGPAILSFGEGSALSGGNTQPDARQRKCQVSFSVILHELAGR
jgi:hypothetical protein